MITAIFNHSLLAVINSDWLLDHAGVLIAVVIVALSILFGASDLFRLNVQRVWAISSVCFAESIRRRVLWITPLAIVGVMVVSQLQRPLDEQDAIRQTTKFCLFTTGMVVVIVAILLASTSLPKEIENRVIFTIVTKPTTRLEIVLGKTLGFARVVAAILLIMGLFTSVYLQVRAWNLQRDIAYRLDTGAVDPVSRATLEHYRTVGLLNAKTFAETEDLQFFGKLPAFGEVRRYASSAADNQILVPFDLTPAMFADARNPAVQFHMAILNTLGASPAPVAKTEEPPATSQPTTRGLSGPSPLLSSTRAAVAVDTGGGTGAIGVLDADAVVIANGPDLGAGQNAPLKPSGETSFAIDLTPDAINKLMAVAHSPVRRVFVAMAGSDPNFLYYADAQPCTIVTAVISADGSIKRSTYLPAPDPYRPGEPSLPIYRGGYSRYGQQLRGSAEPAAVAIYHFRNAQPTEKSDVVNFEMRLGIDRTGTENADESDTITHVQLQVRNDATGKLSAPVTIQPETNRTAFFALPADAVAGGNYELIVRCTSPQHQLGLRPQGLLMVVNSGHFYFNLVKSLGIFWLLSVLVVAVAICCSTFVSWPIAVVLCIVILLGRWGVEQLGDSTKPGIGASVATDFGFRDANQVHVISESVETLTKLLNTLARVLPDISQFPATEDIERGVSVPADKLWESAKETLSFGIPLLLLGYLVFKNKEVAP